jgi:hypothetical protein
MERRFTVDEIVFNGHVEEERRLGWDERRWHIKFILSAGDRLLRI